MKNKGRRYKRAVAAMERWKEVDGGRYSDYHILSVTKNHPNYFVVEIYDSWDDTWYVSYHGYISAYENKNGWVKR